jgi:type II secretory pathway predicted ATPase ExeA/chromosome segregation ATPase
MYCDHFKLQCLPFEDRADRRFFFSTPDRDETLAALEYEIRSGKGMSLVLGSAGTGKTSLIRVLLQRLDTGSHAAVLPWPMVGGPDLIREAAKAFGVTLPASHNRSRCLARFRRHLSRVAGKGGRCVLIIDQAENLSAENLAQLSALGDVETKEPKTLRIVLAGQPHIRTLLSKPTFQRIAQQLFGERVLSTLSRDEIEQYITHRLRVAGAGEREIFTSEAIALIHDASNGIPRLINHMCNAAMVAAYGAGALEITRELASETDGRNQVRERSMSKSVVGVGRSIPAFASIPNQLVPVMAENSEPQGEPQQANGLEFAPQEIAQSSGPPTGMGDFARSTVDVGSSRLEGTMSRLERVQGIADATLAKFAAVENHLATLTESAGRLIHQLGDKVQQAARSQEHLEHGLESQIKRAEQRADAIEARLQQVLDATTDAREQTREIGRVRAKAEGVENRIRSFVEQVADKVDQVQERVAVLMAGTEHAEKMNAAMNDTVKRTSRVRKDADGLAASLRSEIDETISSARKEIDSFTNQIGKTTTDAQQQIREMRDILGDTKAKAGCIGEQIVAEVLQSARKTLETRSDTVIKKHLESVVAAIEDRREELAKVIKDASEGSERVKETITARRRDMDKELEEYRRSSSESLAALDNRIRNLKQEYGTLEAQGKQAESSLASMESAIETSKSQVEVLTTLSTRGMETIQTLSPMFGRFETMVPQARETCAQVESTQQRLSATLQDLSRGIEKVGKIQDQTAAMQSLGDQLAHERVSAARTVKQIEQVIEKGEQMTRRMEHSLGTAHTQVDCLDSLTAVAGKTAEGVSQSTVAGEAVIHRIDEAVSKIERSVGAADACHAKLTTRQADCAGILDQLNDTSSSARQVHDAAQSVVAHVDEKIGRIASHSAAASNVLRNMSEAIKRGHETVKQIDDSKRQLAEQMDGNRQKLDRLVEEVRSLNTRAESNAKTLDTHSAKASTLVKAMESASPRAERATDHLSQQLDHAKDAVSKITTSCRQASELNDQLQAITGLFAAMQEKESAIRRVYEEAQETHERLTGIADTSRGSEQKLTQLNAVAHGLIETYGQMKCETEDATNRLAAQLNATQKSVEVGEPMLSEFIKQSRSIERQLGELGKQAKQFEQGVAEATARPSEILVSAQAQADQLEGVCSAVRKVFAGVSKATLDAKGQSDACVEATKQASEQISVLSIQTDQAITTLREWVEEALRAQARLEKTLATCPTIQDTHPGEVMRRTAQQMRSPAERLANPSAKGELSVMDKARTTGRNLQAKSSAAPSRAQEISTLIEDTLRSGVDTPT